jgi:hypothetical protein
VGDFFSSYDAGLKNSCIFVRNLTTKDMTTIKQLKDRQKYIGNGYTNTTFIMETYKTSTLPRMFYDLKLTVEQIDSNQSITKYLKSAKAIKDGFSQDDLFDVIEKQRIDNLSNEDFFNELFGTLK